MVEQEFVEPALREQEAALTRRRSRVHFAGETVSGTQGHGQSGRLLGGSAEAESFYVGCVPGTLRERREYQHSQYLQDDARNDLVHEIDNPK